MASRQQQKSEEVEEQRANKGEAAEKTLEHQEHFAEGRSHGGETKIDQVRIEEIGTRAAQTMKGHQSASPAHQGIDVDDESTMGKAT